MLAYIESFFKINAYKNMQEIIQLNSHDSPGDFDNVNISWTKDNFSEILFYAINKVDHKIAWGLGVGIVNI